MFLRNVRNYVPYVVTSQNNTVSTLVFKPYGNFTIVTVFKRL
jgi:hypothetical protein